MRRHEGQPVDDSYAYLLDEDAPLEAQLGPGQGEALAWLYRHGRVLSRAEQPDGGLTLAVRLDPQALGRFERLYPQARLEARS